MNTIRYGGEYWKMHDSGEIERPGLVSPSMNWRVVGEIVKYQIYIKYLDGTSSRLLHRGRTEWRIKTARKHLHDCICEKLNDSKKWLLVDYFAIVAA